ncbi:MAG: riboflavin synthase [Leptospirillum sp.]|jgi:riboflavin synthase|nr:riboflavin synthase [Nitrospiraceae bacterium]
MFSGIIETVGVLLETEKKQGGMRFVIGNVPFAGELAIGESVAIDGACMTVVWADQLRSCFGIDLSLETLSVTSMGSWAPGRRVNLERALRLSDRLGGHLVLGHVDQTGWLVSRRDEGGTTFLTIGVPARHASLLIHKGSICVDGISLTVNALSDHPESDCVHVELAIIPHTLMVTNIGERNPGDSLHLEFDVVGKYILRSRDLEKMTEGRFRPI